jgi:ABC-2 type transport system permease protein
VEVAGGLLRADRVLAVAGVEWIKLTAQYTARAVLAACVAGPLVFVAATEAQSSLPEDTLFGRAMKESGFATPLVVLGFASLWIVPVLTSVVGGELFAGEDRHGTWGTVLTRSCNRADVFTGKVLIAFGFSTLAIALLAVSSVAAGVLLIGRAPLIDLSGVLLSPAAALGRIALAWASILPPAFGLTTIAILLSIATRSSAAGVGLPVVVALAMQLCSYLDGPEPLRRLLVTSSFAAWHGLLAHPSYYRPLIDGAVVSAAYGVVCLALAFQLMRQRDIAR